MNTIIKRTIFGFLYVVIFLGSFWFNTWLFFAVLSFIVAVGSDELCRLICPEMGLKKRVWFDSISLIFFISSFFLEKDVFLVISILLLLLILFGPFIIALFSKKFPFTKISTIIWTSVVLIVIPASIMLSFLQNPTSHDFSINETSTKILFTLIFALISINDIFAYLVGSTIGKHKLFERISPAKTVEGSLGGLVFTILTAYLCNHFWLNICNDVKMIGLSLIIVVFGSLGDLIESMLKRQAGVKDSGNIIPGHGGILDRFDALLFALPFVYIYSLFISII